MVSKIRQILEITKEADLKSEFGDFEDSVEVALHEVVSLMAKDVRSTDVVSILDHMTAVEKHRANMVRYLALANAFVSHCKSDHFIVPKAKGQTEFDRTAYQKKLTAGFGGMEIYLEGLIYSLDSRVNICKKLMGLEETGFNAKLK